MLVTQGWEKGKPDFEWWQRAVQEGITYRKEMTHEEDWDKWRGWYRGKWPPGILPTNIYFKMIRTLVPRVYYRNPSVSVTATLPGIEQMLYAKLLERADNKLLDLMSTKQQMKRAVQLAVMFGTSVPMMGYGAQFSHTPEELTTEAPEGGTKRMVNRVEYHSLVHPDTPHLLTEHPGNIVFPKKCASWEEARWICQLTRRPVGDLKADKRFKNTENLPEVGSKGGSIRYDGAPGTVLPEGVRLWIIRDKKTQQVFVLAPDGDEGAKVLYQEDDELQIDGGLPAYPLVFNTDDESVWGVPDSKIIEPQQTEINECRTLIMRHRRISLVKFLVEQNAIDPDEASKLIDDDVGAMVKVKNVGMVKELTPAQIPTALLQSEQLTAQDVQEILGLGTNQFGEYAPGSADRSATEANIVNQATQIRVDERRDTCADLLVNFVSDMNQVIVKHWDRDIVESVIGPGGVEIWIKFQPQELRQGHYVTKIDPDSSVPLTKQVREQRAVQGYTLFKDNPMIDPFKLTQMTVNEVYSGDVMDLIKEMGNTSPGNPMSVPQAAQRLQGIGAANGQAGPVQ